MGVFFFNILMYFLKEYLFLVFIRDLSFGILFIRKLHQVHFVFLLLLLGLITSLHFWFRDLLREFYKKYEILLMVLFLVFFLFLASEALLFISFFWASFHSL